MLGVDSKQSDILLKVCQISRFDLWAKIQKYFMQTTKKINSLEIKLKMLFRSKTQISVNNKSQSSLLLPASPISICFVPVRNSHYCLIQASTCNKLDFRVSWIIAAPLYFTTVLSFSCWEPGLAVSARKRTGLLWNRNMTMNVNPDRRGNEGAREGNTALTFRLYFFQLVGETVGIRECRKKLYSLRQKMENRSLSSLWASWCGCASIHCSILLTP